VNIFIKIFIRNIINIVTTQYLLLQRVLTVAPPKLLSRPPDREYNLLPTPQRCIALNVNSTILAKILKYEITKKKR
jgi:hypothetical protein